MVIGICTPFQDIIQNIASQAPTQNKFDWLSNHQVGWFRKKPENSQFLNFTLKNFNRL